MFEICAMPNDLHKVCQAVTAFRPPILVWCQVPGNHGRTCVTVRSGRRPYWTKVLATTQVDGWVHHLRLAEVRVSTLRIVEVWRPAGSVSTIAVAHGIDQVAAEHHQIAVFTG